LLTDSNFHVDVYYSILSPALARARQQTDNTTACSPAPSESSWRCLSVEGGPPVNQPLTPGARVTNEAPVVTPK